MNNFTLRHRLHLCKTIYCVLLFCLCPPYCLTELKEQLLARSSRVDDIERLKTEFNEQKRVIKEQNEAELESLRRYVSINFFNFVSPLAFFAFDPNQITHALPTSSFRYFEQRLRTAEESYREEIALLQLRLVEGALEESVLKTTYDRYASRPTSRYMCCNLT